MIIIDCQLKAKTLKSYSFFTKPKVVIKKQPPKILLGSFKCQENNVYWNCKKYSIDTDFIALSCF